jgi:hypothetical protein
MKYVFSRNLALLILCISLTCEAEQFKSDEGFPSYLKEIRSELREQSREELMDLICTAFSPGSMPDKKEIERRQHAFIILRNRGLTVPEVRRLIEQATDGSLAIHRLSVFSGIHGPVYESTATAEEKAITDELIRILLPLLEEKPPLPQYAVEALFRMINQRDKFVDSESGDQRTKTLHELPYRNADILKILLENLRHESLYVREEVVRKLASAGGNDPDAALSVIKALDKQKKYEAATTEYANEQKRQNILRRIDSARDVIIRDVETFLRYGGSLAGPEAWTSYMASEKEDK